MSYRFHDDIVYTRVCGISMLVALRGSWDRFPAVRQVSPLQGCFCEGISQGMEEDELVYAIHIPEKMSRETVRRLYRSFVAKMLDEGVILEEDSGDGT